MYLTTVPEGGGGETMFIDVPARDADGARAAADGGGAAARPPPLYAQFGDDVQASKDYWEGVTRGHADVDGDKSIGTAACPPAFTRGRGCT